MCIFTNLVNPHTAQTTKSSPVCAHPHPGEAQQLLRGTKWLRWTQGASLWAYVPLYETLLTPVEAFVPLWDTCASLWYKNVCFGCFVAKSLFTCFRDKFCEKFCGGGTAAICDSLPAPSINFNLLDTNAFWEKGDKSWMIGKLNIFAF